MNINQNHFGRLLFFFVIHLNNSIFFAFRTRLLSDVYSLLADLIDWSDKLLLLKINDTKSLINDDDKYKPIAHDLLEAIKVKQQIHNIHSHNQLPFRIVYHLHVIQLQLKALIHVQIQFKVFNRLTG